MPLLRVSRKTRDSRPSFCTRHSWSGRVREWSLLIFQKSVLLSYLVSFGKTRVFLNNRSPFMSYFFFRFSMEHAKTHMFMCSRCENRTGLGDGRLLRRGDSASPSWKAFLMAMIVTHPSLCSFSSVVVFLYLVSSLVKRKLKNKINMSN